MKQSSKRITSLLVSFLFVVLALVLFFNLVEPAYSSLEALKGQLGGEQQLLVSETGSVAQAQKLIAQYQSQTQTQQSLALAMPSGEDLSGALAQIYGLATNSGIALAGVGITAPTLQTASNVSSTQLVKPLGDVSFQITGTGSYEALSSFLSGLATNIRIFDLKALTISPGQSIAGGNTKAPQQDFFNYSLTVVAYYQGT